MSNMSETYTPQQSEFDKQTEEALQLANQTPLEPVDDLEFFNNAAAAAKRFEIPVTQDTPGAAQEVTVHHEKPSAGKKILAGAGIAAAIVTAGAVGVGPIGDAVDAHFDHVDEQNKKWADEAAENQRQFEDGVIQIEVPNDEQK